MGQIAFYVFQSHKDGNINPTPWLSVVILGSCPILVINAEKGFKAEGRGQKKWYNLITSNF